MKRIITFAAVCALLSAGAFARKASISVEAGENWQGKHMPQFAVWIEDTDGTYIRTLYTTNKAGKKNWLFAPKEGRPESLPVWYHASKQDPRKGKEARKANESLGLDAVSSATPKGGTVFSTQIPDKTCIIKAEFNVSFDYNEFYTKENSAVNGQPSVIYGAELPETSENEICLSFLGTGSIDGTDGEIHTNTKELTSAGLIVQTVSVTFTAEKPAKKTITLSITTDAVYYPKSEYRTGKNHFAPITEPFSSFECRTTLSADYSLSTPLGEHQLVSGVNVLNLLFRDRRYRQTNSL